MLIDALRRRLGDAGAQSFQLFGEELLALSGADLAEAAAAWQAALARVRAAQRARVEAELTSLQREALAFVRKYNRSVHGRLGRLRRDREALPLRLSVAGGGHPRHRAGDGGDARRTASTGSSARRRGAWAGAASAELTDGSEDVLRRTNRGIFADSLPTVLLGAARRRAAPRRRRRARRGARRRAAAADVRSI